MKDAEKRERIRELTDKTCNLLNEKQKEITDQLRKVTETVKKSKPEGERRSIVEAITPLVEIVKLYKAVESYNNVLVGLKQGIADYPPIKLLADVMGIKSSELIEILACSDDLVKQKLEEVFGESVSPTEEETSENKEDEGEEEEKDEEVDDGFDVLITFGRTADGKTFLDQMINDETEDKAFILKRDPDTGYLDAFIGLKCVDETGKVGYVCSRWKPAKYGDICITGGDDEEDDDQE